jgi:hypothetical protein
MPVDFPSGLDWLRQRGLSDAEIRDLNPCVPGEFTLQNTFYVNTGTKDVVYRGTEEGTLPLVTGRWYLIPGSTIKRHPDLARDAVPPARAVRLTR